MPVGKHPSDEGNSAFLNVPYDPAFEKLYLAYIAGISAFNLKPRATLEIPGSRRRLDRILELIQKCRYSIHDLSRVQLDRNKPRTPRFNMPFELGLVVTWSALINQQHAWYVLETVKHRVPKSLSDLNGTEIYIHDGTVRGVLRELSNAFVRRREQPTVQHMYDIYCGLREGLPAIMQSAGAADPFTARVFQDLCLAARTENIRLGRRKG